MAWGVVHVQRHRVAWRGPTRIRARCASKRLRAAVPRNHVACLHTTLRVGLDAEEEGRGGTKTGRNMRGNKLPHTRIALVTWRPTSKQRGEQGGRWHGIADASSSILPAGPPKPEPLWRAPPARAFSLSPTLGQALDTWKEIRRRPAFYPPKIHGRCGCFSLPP